MNNGNNLPTKTGDNPFLAYGEQTRQTAIVGKLLKFSKGEWFAGQDNDEVPVGTKFVANMSELLVGWVRWADNRPTDHIMGKVIDGFQPQRRNELGDLNEDDWDVGQDGQPRDPWQLTNYLLMMGVDGDNQLYTFTTSSKGGINAIGDLCMKYGKAARERPKDWPIVKIGTGSYQHPNRELGRIKYPMFEITGWAPKASFAAIEGSAVPEEEEAPTPPVPPATQAKARLKARF